MSAFLRPLHSAALLALLVLVAALPAIGQTPVPENQPDEPAAAPSERSWRFGFKAGLSSSRYYGDTLANYIASSQRLGFAGGAQFTLLLDDNIRSRAWLQTEVLFATQGVQRNSAYTGFRKIPIDLPGNISYLDSTTFDSSSSSVTLDFVGTVQVPVMFRMDFGAANVKPYVALGPVFGFNMVGRSSTTADVSFTSPVLNANGEAQQETIDGSLLLVEQPTNTEVTVGDTALAEFNTFELSSVVMAGVLFPIKGTTAFFIEGRYNISWSKFYTDDRNSTRNQALMLLLGIEF